jgi:hypothetical protein
LTFLDGPSVSLAIQSRKKVYEDESGRIYIYMLGDDPIIESRLDADFVLKNFKHWRVVQNELEEALRARGFKRYFALVDSYDKFRWCEWLGMHTTYVTYNDTIELMIKEL